ncbi:rhodanese-like domain-containing protein [Leucothrix pacifica]|uniref:Sulfurtransferase n=1 Tax=Leucothrix pacifica TaxID=1247513 RepID=A0A317C0Z8_9GAMM|nr:rhodanese-like domain-containing protein [Leucothrix pacifica]PWQ92027.1 sulfurtransferase [Leucothrix pacifica]
MPLKTHIIIGFTLLLLAISLITTASAENAVKITPTLEFVDVQHDGETIRIEREQNVENRLSNSFSKTSRACPPFCIQPANLLESVTTVAELEVLRFLDTQVKNGQGLLVDSRMPEWHEKGTIPGSVNIPFTILNKGLDSKHIVRIIELLGATQQNGKWDFSKVRDLMLFCNGPWCGQSTQAINNLAKIGYPEDKLFWYRGGMQAWQQLGLTVVIP